MAEQAGEKTFDPTPQRLRKAREEGRVPRSTDLTAAVALLAGVVLLFSLGGRVLHGLHRATGAILSGDGTANPTRMDDLPALAGYSLQSLAYAALPLLLTLMAVAAAVTAGQVGFMVTGQPLAPKWSRINPLSGLKNLFNARAAVRLGMSLGKVTLVSLIAISLALSDLPAVLRLGELDAVPGFIAGLEIVYYLSLKLAAALLILAILDYAYQRHQHRQDLMMTRQEHKEELRQMDGDPMVKQRRARVARQLALQRVGSAVPRADVIVTNPTHFSVALQYDAGSMRAPKVVAKGADFLAMRIRQLAAQHGVPLVERKPLARALYAGVEVGQEVPPEHYAAVAEILAYVYRLGERS